MNNQVIHYGRYQRIMNNIKESEKDYPEEALNDLIRIDSNEAIICMARVQARLDILTSRKA
jgi:hypothetical protein